MDRLTAKAPAPASDGEFESNPYYEPDAELNFQGEDPDVQLLERLMVEVCATAARVLVKSILQRFK